MLIQKNNLYLDHIITTNLEGERLITPIATGVTIKIKDGDIYLPIANIMWSEDDQDCYIQTIKDRFQTYIVLYPTFADFIYLVDEAYRMICLLHPGAPKIY